MFGRPQSRSQLGRVNPVLIMDERNGPCLRRHECYCFPVGGNPVLNEAKVGRQNAARARQETLAIGRRERQPCQVIAQGTGGYGRVVVVCPEGFD